MSANDYDAGYEAGKSGHVASSLSREYIRGYEAGEDARLAQHARTWDFDHVTFQYAKSEGLSFELAVHDPGKYSEINAAITAHLVETGTKRLDDALIDVLADIVGRMLQSEMQ